MNEEQILDEMVTWGMEQATQNSLPGYRTIYEEFKNNPDKTKGPRRLARRAARRIKDKAPSSVDLGTPSSDTDYDVEGMAEWALAQRDDDRLYATQDEIQTKFGVSDRHSRAVTQEARRIISSALETEEERPGVADLVRENHRLQKELKRQKQAGEVFLELLPAVTEDLLPPAPPRQYEPKKRSEKLPAKMLMQLSDTHCGCWEDSELTLGLGGYDRNILRERLRRYVETAITVVEEWRMVREVPELIMFWLGDLLDGENIYKGQKWLLDASLQQQFVWMANELLVSLMELAAHFEKVTVYGVAGNHGRLGGRKGESIPSSSADTLLMRHLQGMSEHVEGLKNVEFHVSKSYLLAVEIDGFVHLLRHGDDIRRYMRIPWYSAERNTMRYANLTRLPVTYAHVGHNHKDATWPISMLRILANGSVVGATSWSINKLQEGDLPTQNLAMLHQEQGLTWPLPVTLAEPDELVPDEAGIFTAAWGPDDARIERKATEKGANV